MAKNLTSPGWDMDEAAQGDGGPHFGGIRVFMPGEGEGHDPYYTVPGQPIPDESVRELQTQFSNVAKKSDYTAAEGPQDFSVPSPVNPVQPAQAVSGWHPAMSGEFSIGPAQTPARHASAAVAVEQNSITTNYQPEPWWPAKVRPPAGVSLRQFYDTARANHLAALRDGWWIKAKNYGRLGGVLFAGPGDPAFIHWLIAAKARAGIGSPNIGAAMLADTATMKVLQANAAANTGLGKEVARHIKFPVGADHTANGFITHIDREHGGGSHVSDARGTRPDPKRIFVPTWILVDLDVHDTGDANRRTAFARNVTQMKGAGRPTLTMTVQPTVRAKQSAQLAELRLILGFFREALAAKVTVGALNAQMCSTLSQQYFGALTGSYGYANTITTAAADCQNALQANTLQSGSTQRGINVQNRRQLHVAVGQNKATASIKLIDVFVNRLDALLRNPATPPAIKKKAVADKSALGKAKVKLQWLKTQGEVSSADVSKIVADEVPAELKTTIETGANQEVVQDFANADLDIPVEVIEEELLAVVPPTLPKWVPVAAMVGAGYIVYRIVKSKNV